MKAGSGALLIVVGLLLLLIIQRGGGDCLAQFWQCLQSKLGGKPS